MSIFSKKKSPGLIEVAAMMLGFLAAVVLLSLNSARAKSRDAKRMADVRQMASALELYANDHRQYPKKFEDLTPNYIGQMPIAPLPADGSCTTDNNEYKYAQRGAEDYQLTFCLGQTTGGYAAGTHTLTKQGIH
ncbi:MAG: hypothetical protein M1400_00680 [Patescibacteria group bacterium]|nr:hypothetical protein [Patescibacteria group bacterium]